MACEPLPRAAANQRNSTWQQERPQTEGPDLHYLFAPLKRARLDYMVQKATELGVSRLRPVLTRRTMAERINETRLRANAIEAAEQCGILRVPEIEPPEKLSEAARNLGPRSPPHLRRRASANRFAARGPGGAKARAARCSDRPRGWVRSRRARASPKTDFRCAHFAWPSHHARGHGRSRRSVARQCCVR